MLIFLKLEADASKFPSFKFRRTIVGRPLIANHILSCVSLEQLLPTGGSRYPGVPKQVFLGSELRFSRVRVCKFLDVLLFKRREIYGSLQVLLLKIHYAANVTNLTISNVKCVLCYFCFTLRLPRWRWPVMRLQAHCDV